MASTRLAAVLSAARGVSCRGAPAPRPRCRRHRLTQSVVTALGPRSPPAPPSRRRSTWRTPGQVPARVAGRQLDAARDAVRRRPTGGRGRAPVRPAAGSIRPLNARLQGGPQPPAARSASNGAQGASPGVGVVSTGRSRGRSTLPTALMWPSSAPRCAAAGVSRPVRRPVEPLISRPAAPLRDPRPSPRHPRSVPGPPLARGDP